MHYPEYTRESLFSLYTLSPEHRSSLPVSAGVYIFKDAQGRIIYIGKACSLKQRVSTYFQGKQREKRSQIATMCAGISYIVTSNETEAYILEAELIRTYQPVYNILLRSGRPFIYIVFDYDCYPPTLYVTRKCPKHGQRVYGPFVHRRHAHRVFRYLQRIFQLTLCSYRVAGGCLDYHLGRCAGNCAGTFDNEAYTARLELAEKMLAGQDDTYIQKIRSWIDTYNHEYKFEKAAHLYAYLRDMEQIRKALSKRFSADRYKKEIMHAITPHFSQPQHISRALHQMQDVCGLSRPAYTIDCFDISHFQGNAIVGACVRFTNGLPDSNMFRRFYIRSLHYQDDYAALKEIVRRRYRRDPVPDIVLIDGGKGQRNAVARAHPDLYVMSIAKRYELLYTPLSQEGHALDCMTAYGQLLIALRDYTHQAALSYHRKKRSQRYRLHTS